MNEGMAKGGILSAATVSDFVDQVSRLGEDWSSDLWFRGHADFTWELLPWLYRLERGDEKTLRDEFRRRAATLSPETLPSNEWDLYFLMQHYGVPTRPLDWTDGALLGLYFAVRENSGDRDAAVWVLDPFWLNKQVLEQEVIFGTRDPEVQLYLPPTDVDQVLKPFPVAIEPSHISRRITAQHSCFTIHGSEKKGLNFVGKEEKQQNLVKVRVPKENIEKVKRDLARCGIVETTVFPDLGGLGWELRWTYTKEKQIGLSRRL